MTAGMKKFGVSQKTDKVNYPQPVDVIDAIPDRSGNRRPWKYLAVAGVFLAWIGFLIICGLVGTL